VRIEVRAQAFDPWVEIGRYQTGVLSQQGRYGATAVFVGTMRDVNEAAAVHAMTLEHYPGMTERHLQRISEEAMGRWDIIDILILHRVGELRPGDPIVLIAVWSAHRAAAFEACRFLIEDLKSRAPFWKKERLDAGFRWVEKNTPG
jgi:molybdopterin synthase catalytic subunit